MSSKPTSVCRFRLAVVYCVLFCSWAVSARGAELRGRVTDSVSGFGIEGAVVGLDADPTNGVFESEAATDTFGFYDITGITADTYGLDISHPAYLPHVETIELVDGPPSNRVDELDPIPGENRFDILFHVVCVTTELPLRNVPVVVRRFSNASDQNPSSTTTVVTDRRGIATARGALEGHYEFAINSNPPGGTLLHKWKPLSPAGRQFLDQTHVAGVMLEPVPQPLTITVRGFDPVKEEVGPLENIIVELTGLDPRDGETEMVPPRAGLTDTSGQVTFTGLPAVSWIARATDIAYMPAEVRVTAPNGTLVDPAPLMLTLRTNDLHVTLTSPYPDTDILTDLKVELYGLKDSRTKEIERSETASHEARPDRRKFTNLAPGRYRVVVESKAPSDAHEVKPYFRAEDYVEVVGPDDTELTLELEVLPAVIRGRLFAADGHADMDQPGNPDNMLFSSFYYVYQPHQQTGIEVVEYDADQLVPASNAVVSIDTDETGAFALSALPSRYGIRITGMTEYWGSHIILTDLATGESLEQGWPFHQVWPYTGQPPSNDTQNVGLPLVLESGREYSLDVFVRRQVATISSNVIPDGKPPTERLITVLPVASEAPTNTPYCDLVNGGGFIRVETAGSSNTIESPIRGPLNGPFFLIPDLSAGSYTLSGHHDRFEIKTLPLAGTTIDFTISPWNPPGVLPASDPLTDPNYRDPLSHTPPLLPPAFGYFHADYIDSTNEITIEEKRWNELFERYESTMTELGNHSCVVIQPDYTGDNLFWKTHFTPLPTGLFTYYLQFPLPGGGDGEFGWFAGRTTNEAPQVHAVYVGGPSNEITATPAISLTLTVKAVSDADPTLLIGGVQIDFGGVKVTTDGTPNQTIQGFQGSPRPVTATHATWLYSHSELGVISESVPHLLATVRMTHGMGLSGGVTNGVTATPVAGAKVQIRDRFGAVIRQLASDRNGRFELASALPVTETVYIDVSAPGFYPFRERHHAASFVNGPNDDVVLEVEAILTPLPTPSMDATTLNRYGLFLPGVNTSGDEGVFGLSSAETILTMGWTQQFTEAQFTIQEVPFDNPNGTARSEQSREVIDTVEEVWVIDPRSFADHPYDDEPVAVPPPSDTNDVQGLREWLSNIATGGVPNVYRQVVRETSRTDATHASAAGQIKLWQLRPGAFDPVIVAVTRLGAVGIKTTGVYAMPEEQRLEGVRLRPWMANLADLFAFIAGVQATAKELDGVLPRGRFEMIPEFTATIEEHPAEAYYLHYLYQIYINWTEGMETPLGGALSFGPAVLGLTFEGEMNFDTDGKKRKVNLGVSGLINTKRLTHTEMLPKGLAEILDNKGVSVEGQFHASGSSTDSTSFAPLNDLYEHELTHTVRGGLDSTVKVRLDPIVGAVPPPVGPVLLSLGKTDALVFRGEVTGGLGARSTATWRTTFPPSKAGTTTDRDSHVLRRERTGGDRPIEEFYLCFRFGLGLNVEALGGTLGGTGRLLLQGSNCTMRVTNSVPLDPAPSMKVTPNPDPDWPPIKRVQGHFGAEFEAFLDVWITRFEKKWSVNFFPFDRTFGTDQASALPPMGISQTMLSPGAYGVEPVFELVPMGITQGMLGPGNAPGATFNGTMPVVLEDLYAPGGIDVVPGATDLMVYTDVQPGGEMVLMASGASGIGPWAAPVQVGGQGGVLTVAVAPLSAGGWMTVWTELDSADVNNPYPSSRLMYSVSDADGANWSAAAEAAALAGVAARLHLLSEGAFVGLLFEETTDGPASPSFTLKATTWNGAAWSAPETVLGPEPIYALDAAVMPGPQALIAYTTDTNALKWLTWDGAVFSAPAAFATETADWPLGLTAVDDGTFTLAWAPAPIGLGLRRYTPGSGWTDLGVLSSNAVPGELAIASLSGTETGLVAWVEGGAAPALWYAFFDEDGNVLSGPSNLTRQLTGRYHDVSIIPVSSGTARIQTLFSASPTELREFVVSLDQAVGTNDADRDGMDDLLELIIIDADPGDGITTIHHVDPWDDFDADGTANYAEFYLGMDPTDPLSTLRIDDLTVPGDAQLSFVSADGVPYILQGSTNLLNVDSWEDLKTVLGNGLFMTVPQAPTDPNAFYRLKVNVPVP